MKQKKPKKTKSAAHSAVSHHGVGSKEQRPPSATNEGSKKHVHATKHITSARQRKNEALIHEFARSVAYLKADESARKSAAADESEVQTSNTPATTQTETEKENGPQDETDSANKNSSTAKTQARLSPLDFDLVRSEQPTEPTGTGAAWHYSVALKHLHAQQVSFDVVQQAGNDRALEMLALAKREREEQVRAKKHAEDELRLLEERESGQQPDEAEQAKQLADASAQLATSTHRLIQQNINLAKPNNRLRPCTDKQRVKYGEWMRKRVLLSTERVKIYRARKYAQDAWREHELIQAQPSARDSVRVQFILEKLRHQINTGVTMQLKFKDELTPKMREKLQKLMAQSRGGVAGQKEGDQLFQTIHSIVGKNGKLTTQLNRRGKQPEAKLLFDEYNSQMHGVRESTRFERQHYFNPAYFVRVNTVTGEFDSRPNREQYAAAIA